MEFKKILVIYNPKSGSTEIRLEDYLKALAERGAAPVLRTVPPNFDLKTLLADASDFERIVVAGGDGTVSSVAAALMGTGIPIVAYPGGTANLLASNLKMPMRPSEIAELTLNGPTMKVDMGKIEYKAYRRRDYFRVRFGSHRPQDLSIVHFIIMAGSGFAAHLMKEAKPLKSRFGKAAYWMGVLLNQRLRFARFRLCFDGEHLRVRGIGVIIVNFEKIQFDLKLVPDSNASDGKFEIVVLKAKTLLGLLPSLCSLIFERFGFKRPDMSNEMVIHRGADIEVNSWPPLYLQFDGETLPRCSFFKVTAIPRSAVFVIPNKVNS